MTAPYALREAARRVARAALDEDLAGFGDLTGRAFDAPGRARIEARQTGVLSGTLAVDEAAHLVDPELRVTWAKRDGDAFAAGETIVALEGAAAALLALERTALNLLSHLSGVATLTARFVAAVDGTGARIAGTRKTTPGLRALEKQAIVAGGGLPHRFGLFDGALIKDNHVAAAGGVGRAVELVRESVAHGHGIEVEVDTLEQLDEALEAGVTAILLDNMGPDRVREAVARVAGRAVIEVSGGVTLESVRAFAEAGADIVSAGALTTSAPWVDLSMVVE
jgi:nicotinate-nucleotide pyrophosphorylase (carboxylating)